MGSPVALLVLFVVLAVCAVLLALPALKGPPPGFEPKICDACQTKNKYTRDTCGQCGEPLKDRWAEDELEGTISPTDSRKDGTSA